MAAKTQAVEGDGGLYLPSDSARPYSSTGCSLMDLQLGNGICEEQIVVFRGCTGSGKSLMAVECCANFVAKHPKGRVMYVDREDAFDEGYVDSLGIDHARFELKRDWLTVEEVTAEACKLIEGNIASRKKVPDPILFVIDSWDALTTKAELKRKSGDKTYGMEKSKLGQEFGRRITALMAHPKARFTILVVCQIRVGSTPDGLPTRKTSGGSWLKYYPSQIIDLKTKKKIEATMQGHKREFGVWVEAKLVKNRRAGPNTPIMIPIRNGYGVCDLMACVRFLADEGRADLMFDGETAEDRKKKAMLFCTSARRLSSEKYTEHLATAQRHSRDLFLKIRAMFAPSAAKYGNKQ